MDVQTFLLIYIVVVVAVGAGWFIYDANRD
jgi:hypothetical protein